MKVVRAEAGRRVALLMAAKSLKRAVIGTLSKGVGALPVARSQDSLKPGKGTIYLPDPQNKPTLLRGIGTSFDGPDFEVGGTISLPSINGRSNSSRIQKIFGPEEIILKTPFEGKDPNFQLTGSHDPNSDGPTPGFSGCKFKFAPHVDQTEVYDAVFKRLNAGGCVGIFPEGGSHDRPNLLPLKGEPHDTRFIDSL
jgi:glycerol-3-phosphate O-acyltransferase/dihydroxyacetone phosphate acyltransferase